MGLLSRDRVSLAHGGDYVCHVRLCCAGQTLGSRLMGCLHGLCLALRRRAPGGPAVWSRVAPAGSSPRGLRAVYAIRGRDK